MIFLLIISVLGKLYSLQAEFNIDRAEQKWDNSPNLMKGVRKEAMNNMYMSLELSVIIILINIIVIGSNACLRGAFQGR